MWRVSPFPPVVPSIGGGAMGLVKPNGRPVMIPNGLGIIFYAFDTGTAGLYSIPKDCAPGHAFNPDTYYTGNPSSPNLSPSPPQNDADLALQVTGTTAYGTGTLWGGNTYTNFAKPGAGALVGQAGGFGLDGSDAMRAAVNLQAAGTGAAFIMAATHMQTVAGGPYTIICGRGYNLDNPYTLCAIGADSSSNVNFGWSSDGIRANASSGIGSSTPCGFNTLCTTIVNCVNTGPGPGAGGSPGNTVISLYRSINGAAPTLEGQTTSTMFDISASGSSFEDQFQMGTYFHSGAGQQFNTFPGYSYQGIVATKPGGWDSTDRASFAANPYQYLQF